MGVQSECKNILKNLIFNAPSHDDEISQAFFFGRYVMAVGQQKYIQLNQFTNNFFN